MKLAKYYVESGDNRVACHLCPHNCKIAEGKRGICGVRKNVEGKLYSENYGKVCSINIDPIEKKPLYHYFPGKRILSVGTIGCNLHCMFCQNFEISQATIDDYPYLNHYNPEEIVNIALKENDSIGIAYTYNEPTIWYEFVMEAAEFASRKNLKNVIVSNGYVNLDPLEDLCEFVDAFSIDLKAFDEKFYKRLTSSSLQPVLESLKLLKEKQKHIEITNLIIPGENDDEKKFREMIDWISSEIGEDTVFHISRFFPAYKMTGNATPESTLKRFFDIAREKLNYVYLGNFRSDNGQNTYCKKCGDLVINRYGYFTTWEGLGDDGSCINCGQKIIQMS